jgi:hypothetical protein
LVRKHAFCVFLRPLLIDLAKFSLDAILGAHSNLLHLPGNSVFPPQSLSLSLSLSLSKLLNSLEIEFSLNYQHSTYLLFEKGKETEAISKVQVGADRYQVIGFTRESLDHQQSAASLFEVQVKIKRFLNLINTLMGLRMDIDFDPQPFIAVPLSSQSESEFYRTNIEPVLLDMLLKLDIRKFLIHIGNFQLAYI